MISCFNSKLRLNIPDSRSLTSGHLTEHETARVTSHVGGLCQRTQTAADLLWGFSHRLGMCGQHLSRYGSAADINQVNSRTAQNCLLDHILYLLCSGWINQHEIKTLVTSVFWVHFSYLLFHSAITFPVCLRFPSPFLPLVLWLFDPAHHKLQPSVWFESFMLQTVAADLFSWSVQQSHTRANLTACSFTNGSFIL